MRLKFENIKENPVSLLRRAGYVFQHKEGEKMSFIKSLARAGYPRFHIYTEPRGNSLMISLHLDQKKETYGQVTRHHGEYEDDGALQTEAVRVRQMLI